MRQNPDLIDTCIGSNLHIFFSFSRATSETEQENVFIFV